MKPITYKISRGYNNSAVSSQIEVEGVLLFELYGYQWAAHPDEQEIDPHTFVTWIVSEVSTGCELVSGKTLLSAQEASEWAMDYLLKKGEAMTRFHVEKARMKLQEYETLINQSTSIQK